MDNIDRTEMQTTSVELRDEEKQAAQEVKSAVDPPMMDNTAVEHPGSTKTESSHREKEEEEIEYPAKWRLALITIALCLSVFCMALVRAHTHRG